MGSGPKQETQKTALQSAVEKIIEASKTITPEESLKSVHRMLVLLIPKASLQNLTLVLKR